MVTTVSTSAMLLLILTTSVIPLSVACAPMEEAPPPTAAPDPQPQQGDKVPPKLFGDKCPTNHWSLGPNGRCYLIVPSLAFNLNRNIAVFACTTQRATAKLTNIDNAQEIEFIRTKIEATNEKVLEHEPNAKLRGYWVLGRSGLNCDSIEVENGLLSVQSMLCSSLRGFICEVEAEF